MGTLAVYGHGGAPQEGFGGNGFRSPMQGAAEGWEEVGNAVERVMTDWLEVRGEAVRIRVRVQPRASRTEVAGIHGDALKIRVSSPPVDGAANEELVKFLAKRLGVSSSRVRVVSGGSARSKLIEIEGAGAAEVEGALT